MGYTFIVKLLAVDHWDDRTEKEELIGTFMEYGSEEFFRSGFFFDIAVGENVYYRRMRIESTYGVCNFLCLPRSYDVSCT